jgi:hypothetical protein
MTARANLAVSYQEAGRTSEAIALLEQVVADRKRLFGNNHPSTLGASNSLSRWQSAVDDLGQSEA